MTPQNFQTAVCAKRAKKPYNFCFKREQSSFELIPVPVSWQGLGRCLMFHGSQRPFKNIDPFFLSSSCACVKSLETKIVKYPTKIQSWHRPIHTFSLLFHLFPSLCVRKILFLFSNVSDFFSHAKLARKKLKHKKNSLIRS